MTPGQVEKTLKRLTWLVSVTAFVGFFVAFAINTYDQTVSQKLVVHYLDEDTNAMYACNRGEAKQCRSIEDKKFWKSVLDSTFQSRSKAQNLSNTFFILLLAVPTAFWFLFFSIRWVLTGRKPWQRGSLPSA